MVSEREKVVTYSRPRKYVHSSGSDPPELGYVDIRTLAEGVCRYDLNEMDVAWLELINEEFREMGNFNKPAALNTSCILSKSTLA